jgi:hypothetical protein
MLLTESRACCQRQVRWQRRLLQAEASEECDQQGDDDGCSQRLVE